MCQVVMILLLLVDCFVFGVVIMLLWFYSIILWTVVFNIFWVTPSKKVPKEASKDASARVLICAHGSLWKFREEIMEIHIPSISIQWFIIIFTSSSHMSTGSLAVSHNFLIFPLVYHHVPIISPYVHWFISIFPYVSHMFPY